MSKAEAKEYAERLKRKREKFVFNVPKITDVRRLYGDWRRKPAPDKKYERRIDALRGTIQMNGLDGIKDQAR